jgi:hypothetical protein
VAENTSKKTKGPAQGERRLRVSYSPDGFRGVKDFDDELAAVMVAEHRATYVDDDTPLGAEELEGPEFRMPMSASADTSSNGAEGSTTAASTASSTTSSSSSPSTR